MRPRPSAPQRVPQQAADLGQGGNAPSSGPKYKVRVPVVATGGIADGRCVAAALLLGQSDAPAAEQTETPFTSGN